MLSAVLESWARYSSCKYKFDWYRFIVTNASFLKPWRAL
jgi:hypothetical protein